MIRLYMDEHVPGPITRGLRRRRVEVLTAQEDGAEGWDDPRLLDRATEPMEQDHDINWLDAKSEAKQ
jgi:hypothetical protein